MLMTLALRKREENRLVENVTVDSLRGTIRIKTRFAFVSETLTCGRVVVSSLETTHTVRTI